MQPNGDITTNQQELINIFPLIAHIDTNCLKYANIV